MPKKREMKFQNNVRW